VRSTDRGASWQKVFNDSTVTPFINDLVMFDSLNGCAIGDPPDATRRPGILKTTDGGSTWQVVINDLPVGDYQSRGRTAFLRPDLAWSKGFNDGIYKSTDGCQTWKRIYPELIPHLLFFLNDSVGFFTSVNSPPGLYKSTDGGATWMRKFYGQDFFWIKWAPGGKVLWAGNDSLFISTNAGESWQPALSNRGQGGCGSFSDAAFLTDDVGLVVGMCLVLGMSQDPDFVPLPQEGDVPHLALQQNYPNPFNPSTTIRYELPYASRVTLTLYNLLGQEVMTLVDGHKPAGMYDVQLNAGSLPSGMYLYRLHAANYFAAKRLLLLK
jgi:hypothetical protein